MLKSCPNLFYFVGTGIDDFDKMMPIYHFPGRAGSGVEFLIKFGGRAGINSNTMKQEKHISLK